MEHNNISVAQTTLEVAPVGALLIKSGRATSES